jgi:hypothetical protein
MPFTSPLLYYHAASRTNIQSSESDLEAEQSRAMLQNLIGQLLESNHEISRRLHSLEDMHES